MSLIYRGQSGYIMNPLSMPIYGATDSVVGAYVSSEFIEPLPTEDETLKAHTDNTTVTNGLGLLLVSLFIVVSGLSVASVTVTLAEVWTDQAQQEINSRIIPSTWRF